MKIVLTSDTNLVYITFNQAKIKWEKATIRKINVRSITLASDNISVGIYFNSGDIFNFDYTYFDSVNGVTPTSNSHLYDLLSALL